MRGGNPESVTRQFARHLVGSKYAVRFDRPVPVAPPRDATRPAATPCCRARDSRRRLAVCVTRQSSDRARFQSGTCMSRRRQTAESNDASANASACASPSENSIASAASCARARATPSISLDASMPVTNAPRFARAIAARPVPVPRSRIRLPETSPRNCDSTRSWSSSSILPDRPAESLRVEASPPSPDRRTPHSCNGRGQTP